MRALFQGGIRSYLMVIHKEGLIVTGFYVLSTSVLTHSLTPLLEDAADVYKEL